MKDIARPQHDRVIDPYLEHETIFRMVGPAQSPDLNQIEHMLNQLQIALSRLLVLQATLQELDNDLNEKWNNLPLATIQTCIRGMIPSHGSHTPY